MNGQRQEAPLLDASFRIDHIPPEGRQIEVRATDAQRAVIAERLDILAVDRLEAKLSLTRFRGGLRVLGRVVAVSEQPCIVTFVPVRQEINEEIDRVFLPAAEQPKSGGTHSEVFVDLETDEMPDYFDGHEVDLSDAIVETVALALDPYPRAEGASLDDMSVPEDDAEVSPFAGLKSLIDPDKKG
ncbi:MAG TPA: DUF177 domain-containing protein [Devosiaceae bacterium]|jgi:uncharacterized metal-binding protein YceD (DUF177 family)|nr:DUF177 domain-containing protein [Devosiaceae bacterium]